MVSPGVFLRVRRRGDLWFLGDPEPALLLIDRASTADLRATINGELGMHLV
jgi:hypothetical protein